jgi:thioredoxin reductase (NADPH)
MENIYDTIIIGGGPAGLSAALYASRSKMDTLLIEKEVFGGQIATTDEIENYPGATENCTGPLLAERMKKQAEEYGTKIVKDEVIDINIVDNIKVVKCKKNTYNTRTIIIATGVYPRLAGFKGENEFRGRGVSYCATCDADFYTELNVAVIGGGDTALTEAIYLTRFADSVTIIHRRAQFRASKYLQEKVSNNPKVKFAMDSLVEEAIEDGVFKGLKLKNIKTSEVTDLKVDGCFVCVGFIPVTELFRGKIRLNEFGYITTDKDMKTNVEGVFAAGDVIEKSVRQAITAASDGAIAATIAEVYIAEKLR